MAKVRICTFNCENLFVRSKFFPLPPGIKSKKAPRADVAKGLGYLPTAYSRNYNLYRDEARVLTALALKRGNKNPYADICCLQEVENMQALRTFNDTHLKKAYPYRLLVDSHDPRLIDVAVLSKYPVAGAVTHMDEKDGKNYLFSRDCLEVNFDINGKRLALFVNHLKSKYATTPGQKANADKRRQMQAERVVEILKERFPGGSYDTSNFAVLGDLNDAPFSDFLSPLVKDAGLENVIDRLPEEERWTHWWDSKNLVSQLDYILLSPSLSHSTAYAKPEIERKGISSKRKKSYLALPGDKKGQEVDFTFKRFDGVTNETEASDHCPVFFELSLP